MTRRFFPLDEELGLLPGAWTPQLHAAAVRLGAWIPSFAQAASLLATFAHTTLSEATVRRHTEAAGAAYVAVQTAAVATLEAAALATVDAPPVGPAAGPALLSLSTDGAMVPLVGQAQWAEVKTLALGEPQPPVVERGQLVVHTTHWSYCSRLTDAATFTRLALVETQRRGVPTAETVVAVNDGAAWIQEFVEYHRADAVRVLDWCHAVGYLNEVATACFGAETPGAAHWLTAQTTALLAGDPAVVLGKLQGWVDDLALAAATLPTAAAKLPIVRRALQYLQPRAAMLTYATFRAQGYPIGSGGVESANKRVVEARLKGAGMHWARAHVDGMLALRTIVCSDRWDEAWPTLAAEVRQQARTQATHRRQARRQARDAVTGSAPPPAPPPPVVSVPPPTPVLEPAWLHTMPTGRHDEAFLTLSVPAAPAPPTAPWRPAASHVWRQGYQARQPQRALTSTVN